MILEGENTSGDHEISITEEDGDISAENSGSFDIAEAGNSKNDEIQSAPSNIMFQNSESNFAFVYPHNDLTISSYSGWYRDYGDFTLNVSTTVI